MPWQRTGPVLEAPLRPKTGNTARRVYEADMSLYELGRGGFEQVLRIELPPVLALGY